MRSFDDFEEFSIQTGAGSVYGRVGGRGPAVLLLHGIPETHLMWRKVAPELARTYTVVATDARGFGRSDPERRPQSDASQAMSDLAAQQVEVMARLGHRRFSVIGHDRGARCAYRIAIDHPARVDALAVLDVVPTGYAYAHADHRFASSFWVWSFLAAPAPVPERLIASNPDFFVDHLLDAWADAPHLIDEEVRKHYRAQFHDPARVHTICEQYRAAAETDRKQDLAEEGRQPIRCPMLVLWSSTGALAEWYDPIEAWAGWASNVDGGPLPGGHFLPEELASATAHALRTFLAQHAA